MAKLYALESADKDLLDAGKNNQMLIDKVLNYGKMTDGVSPTSITSDLLSQRQKLKEDINKQLSQKTPDGTATDDPDDSGDGDTDVPTESNEDPDKEEPTSDKTSDEDKTSEDDKDKNISDAANDEDSLDSVIGSGLKDDKKDSSGNTANESRTVGTSLSNVLNPLKTHFREYTTALEAYNLGSNKIALEEQPIVYVKESIIKTLENLTAMAFNYISNNDTFIKTKADSIKSLNERITILGELVQKRMYHFTNKMVQDKDILSAISCPGKSDIRETSKVLLRYIGNSNKAMMLILKNPYEQIKSSYVNADFASEGDDYVYKDILPGFGIIRMHCAHYKNYLTANMQDSQYYKLKSVKTDDLYSLNAIAITEDKELDYVFGVLDKLLVEISLGTDNLHLINAEFTKFVDNLKVKVFDINKDRYKNLNEVNIDENIKDFIKFKLAIESSYININTMIEYITGVLSVFDVVVELKE